MPPYNESYVGRQCARVAKVAESIVNRRTSTIPGRSVPDHGELPIGVGRTLDATVMFLDVCGSSDRGSDKPDEQRAALAAMTLFFAEAIRIVEDHGGTVEKNTGDGLMAYFATGEDGTTTQQTGVAVAMTIMATAERLVNPVARRIGVETLPFRICLDHGPITIAEVGAARGFRGIVAIGTTANLAAKMLATADEGSIFIGDAVLAGLPLEWQIFSDSQSTRWSHISSGEPYRCHRFDGRWAS